MTEVSERVAGVERQAAERKDDLDGVTGASRRLIPERRLGGNVSLTSYSKRLVSMSGGVVLTCMGSAPLMMRRKRPRSSDGTDKHNAARWAATSSIPIPLIVADNYALTERLIRFTREHELLKENTDSERR
jgi:hypothetical protein